MLVTMADPPHTPAPGTSTRLRRLVEEEEIDLALVRRVAEVDLGRTDEPERIARLRRERGERFYADLLFQLDHRYRPFDGAARLWREILDHRLDLERALGRDPGLAVAALDFQINILKRIDNPRIISEGQLERIAERALRDPLTGLYDRRTFEAHLHAELVRYHRYEEPLSLIMLDLDDFKRVNDERGHPEGDRVLERVGAILRAQCRDMDVTCRYGGEEFAVILPHTVPGEAAEAAERLRALVAAAPELRGVTLSAGVASCPDHGVERATLVTAADDALYAAKTAGKNRIALPERR